MTKHTPKPILVSAANYGNHNVYDISDDGTTLAVVENAENLIKSAEGSK